MKPDERIASFVSQRAETLCGIIAGHYRRTMGLPDFRQVIEDAKLDRESIKDIIRHEFKSQ